MTTNQTTTSDRGLPYRLGAIAFIVDERDRRLLVQLNDYKEDEWNMPGGGREDGETALQNVRREIREELSIDADALTLLGQSDKPLRYDFPPDMDHPMTKIFRGQHKDPFVFRCPDAVKAKIVIDPGELRRSTWCALADLPKFLIFPGQVAHTMAVLSGFIDITE